MTLLPLTAQWGQATPPLWPMPQPIGRRGCPKPRTVVALHATHGRSGASDETQKSLPKRWRVLSCLCPEGSKAVHSPPCLLFVFPLPFPAACADTGDDINREIICKTRISYGGMHPRDRWNLAGAAVSVCCLPLLILSYITALTE